MTLQELKTKANAALATFWTTLQTKEEAYFALHGTYFGFNPSPALLVVDGVDTDFAIEHPKNLVGHHLESIDFPATQLPFQIKVLRCNQQAPSPIYDGQTFTGYTQTGEYYHAYVRVELPNGDVYMRDRTKDNVDSGWYQLILQPV